METYNNCGLLCCEAVNAKDANKKFKLVALPYPENGLAPYISAETLKFHHGKHLAAYVDNTNRLKAGTEYDDMPLHEIVQKASGGLYNNAAQMFNHYFYFEALKPNGDEQPKAGILKLIEENFGTFETFQEQFSQAGATLFGSGWVWLVQNGKKLEIKALPNAETPLKNGEHVLLTMDVWEHAYYLDTQNARPQYIKNFWKVLNWDVVEQRMLH